MTFKQLADYWSELEKTPSRNKMTVILAELFKKASPEEIAKICYLSLGRLAPLYEGIEFNLAEKMMIRILSQTYNRGEAEVIKKYKQAGDLGDVAASLDRSEKTKLLTVVQVYGRLKAIAQEAGEGSVDRKIRGMVALLDDLDSQSAKYLVRIPLGKLRLGFSDKTILDALSWLITGDKSQKETIEAAYNVRADVGQIAQKIRKFKSLKGLKGLKVQVGVPVMPALCQRLPSAEKIIEKMGLVAVEPKYDGTRLTVHWNGSEAKIFTRNLENATHMFPDLIAALPKEVKAKKAILDGEVIGYNPQNGKFLPFQETIKRKRKHQISLLSQQIPLKFYVFDLLYLNGKDFLTVPFEKRRRQLEKIVSSQGKTIVLSPQTITEDPKKLRRLHDDYLKQGLEGVVVKKWQASYDPGKRGYTWVKLKQEKGKKGGGLADTLDTIVMGYYWGKGKRAEFGIGMFLVGIRNKGKILTVSKIGTGLSDEQWREMRARCERAKTKEKPKLYLVPRTIRPDVWCQPEIVVEIEADNITKSPLHTAGLALRFPRLIRFRDDKSSSQATTLKETEKLFRLQK